MRSSEFSRDEGGAALVEATLVLPLVLILLFGLVDVVLYGWQRSAATKAVQLGLRRAIVSDPVARGPGLSEDADATFFGDRPQGQRCEDVAGRGREACPTFAVRCSVSTGCTCTGDRCAFAFVPGNLRPILAAMRAALPQLGDTDVEIGYRTNGLGYVGRPGAVPVDVTVRLRDVSYRPVFLGVLFAGSVPLTAAATAHGEDLRTD